MSPGATLVPRDSPVYQEFARLYRLAQNLRPIDVDRWNGELYSTEGDSWGGFDPASGRISVSGKLVLRHLDGSGQPTSPEGRAQALATVLHEATHAGMTTDAPDEPNAVRSEHSLGIMEGFAEVRALDDFRAFALRAGYADLSLPEPQYPAAHAAAEDLLKQASGPRKPWEALIDEGTRGPGVMLFDQLADGVLRNRLHDVVPDREEDRLAVRAALIEPMMHDGWILLKDLDSADTGREVGRNIRSKLDAKVDQIRRHYRATPGRVFPAEGANAEVVRVAEGNKLAALPPPAASDRVERPVPGGDALLPGARVSGGTDGRGSGGAPEMETQGLGGGSGAQRAGGGLEEREAGGNGARQGLAGSPEGRDLAGSEGRGLAGPGAPGAGGSPEGRGLAGSEAPGAGGEPEVQGSTGGTPVQGSGAGPADRGVEAPGAGGVHAPGAGGLETPGTGEAEASGAGGAEAPGADGAEGPGAGGAEARGSDGRADGRGAGGGVEMRFLDGQAPAAGAVGFRPRLGQWGRGGSGRADGKGLGIGD